MGEPAIDLEALKALAARTDNTVEEIIEMAKMVVLAEYDPLPDREVGEPFDFRDHRKVGLFKNDDFGWINSEIPLPNADVDLFACLREYDEDMEHIKSALEIARSKSQRLGLENACRIVCTLHDWFRFWSLRHPSAEARRAYVDICNDVQPMGSELVLRMAEDIEKRMRDGGGDDEPSTEG